MTDERLDLVRKIKTIIIFAIKFLGTMAGLKLQLIKSDRYLILQTLIY